jgi:hypothetical protein
MGYVALGRKRLVVEVPASTLGQAVIAQAVVMDFVVHWGSRGLLCLLATAALLASSDLDTSLRP